MNAQNIVDAGAISGLILSVVAILLAFFAIWQAWQFYKQAKESETQTAVALAEIKAQTEILQKLTGSQIKTLTKAITSQSPTEKALLDALTAISTGSSFQHRIGVSNLDADQPVLRKELVLAYIALHHYTALANNAFAFSLSRMDDEDTTRTGIQNYVDSTCADFDAIRNLIKTKIDRAEIENSDFAPLYKETQDRWMPLVTVAPKQA